MVRLCELVRCPEKHAGAITVAGWIKTARASKTIGFIELTDGSCFKTVQVVYEQDRVNDETKRALNTGCAISVQGELLLTPDAPQPFEIHAASIVIEGECPGDYPLQKSVTRWNICAPYSTSARVRTPFRQRSACAPLWRRPSTASLTSAAFFTYIRRFSQRAIARAQVRCSA